MIELTGSEKSLCFQLLLFISGKIDNTNDYLNEGSVLQAERERDSSNSYLMQSE